MNGYAFLSDLKNHNIEIAHSKWDTADLKIQSLNIRPGAEPAGEVEDVVLIADQPARDVAVVYAMQFARGQA